MLVTKRDISKKEIKHYTEEVKVATGGRLSGFAFCSICAQPILKFLREYRLTENKL